MSIRSGVWVITTKTETAKRRKAAEKKRPKKDRPKRAERAREARKLRRAERASKLGRPEKPKKKKRISFQISLFITMLFLGLVPMTVTNWILLNTAEDVELEDALNEMQGQAVILANQLSSVGYIDDPDNESMNMVIDQIADIWGGRIQVIDPEYRILRDTYNADTGKLNISENVILGLQGQTNSSFDDAKQFVAFAQPIYQQTDSGEEDVEVLGVILVTLDMEPTVSSLTQIREKALILELTALCVLVLLIFALVSYYQRPLNQMVVVMNKAAEGNLKERVDVRSFKENERLTDAINRTLDRLQLLDESRQEFVSNVSHELKTPITSIRVLADSLMSMEDAPVELYQEFMRDISAEIDRESKIIDDLLSMVRLDQTDMELNISQVSLNELMELILKRLSPIAKQRNIELLFESFRPVTADVDEGKLTLAVTNLVENAIKYNYDSGWVKLSLNADYKYFYIKVSDSGCGIPEDALQHIFERFYRVDKARSRETGGTGLGLSITKTVVQLHHGDIRVYSREKQGTTFVVRIPLIYIKE